MASKPEDETASKTEHYPATKQNNYQAAYLCTAEASISWAFSVLLVQQRLNDVNR